MPTTAERHALLFLAAVALIGGGVRAVGSAQFARESAGAGGAGRPPRAGDLGQKALAAQIAAIDSARQAGKARSGRSGRTTRTAESSRSKRSRPPADSSFGDDLPTPVERKVSPRPPLMVDVNRATLAELERLPRVGPALARRIVAWREAHGPYRSIEDLRHVRGIGPATAALLAPAVTF